MRPNSVEKKSMNGRSSRFKLDFRVKLVFFLILSAALSWGSDTLLLTVGSGSIDRRVIFFGVFYFLSFHLIFDLNTLYRFIFKQRYAIVAVLFVFIVANGYHGSSIGLYNQFIQPGTYISDTEPILGEMREIRSDEWLVSTPFILTQTLPSVNFADENSLIMATENNVNLFPQLPTRNISIVSNLFMTGFLFLNAEMGFSFYWFGRLFAMFFAAFEISMILTKKNKLYSLLGAVLITFAPATQWWFPISILMYGQWAIVFIDRFLKSTKWQMKTLYSFLLALAGSGYIMCIYPAWQAPFGYLFLGLVIWVFIDNKYKFNFVDLRYLAAVIALLSIILVPAVISALPTIKATLATVYPGARFNVGGSGWQRLFNYFNAIFFTYKVNVNPSEYSQYVSLFPIPLLMSLGILTKKHKDKRDPLLIILSLVAVLIGCWNFFPLPEWIARFTLLSYSFPERSNLVVGVICIYLLIILMSRYQSEIEVSLKKNEIALILSISFVMIGLASAHWIMPEYLSLKWQIVSGLVLGLPMFYLLKNQRSTNRYLAVYLILLVLGAGATVNPLSKGLDIMYNKPIAKEVKRIVAGDPNGRWIVTGGNMMMPSYVLANGAKVINSVNSIPNLTLWKKIDPSQFYMNVYNRYAHIVVKLTEAETVFTLHQSDLIIVDLKAQDLCKLDVTYVVTDYKSSQFDSDTLQLELLTRQEKVYLYKVHCR